MFETTNQLTVVKHNLLDPISQAYGLTDLASGPWPNSYCCEETDMDFLWGSPIVSSMYWILLVIPSNSFSLGYSNIPQRTLSYWLYPKLWGYNLINKYPCCWWYPVSWHSYIHTHAHFKSLSCYFSQMVMFQKISWDGQLGMMRMGDGILETHFFGSSAWC